MNIPLKIIAIYKKGNTPLVKYQETANSTCARQIFKLFFEMLSVISGKIYAEMIDAMVEKADQYHDGLTPFFDTCYYKFSASFNGKIYEDDFSVAVDDGSKNDFKRLEISTHIAALLHNAYKDCKENYGGANVECA